eukprot:TRINITY_DN15203_c0_g1_i2.p1 TRINITY_DN15203_c0_g1~~TRINITY_DN15203_c0_g1_i2.p1  ORF type:complete len:147 (-),score=26.91 TRINITY_DN15203_c0_g1_i2:49-465(-)
MRHILDFEEEDWLTREEVHKGLQVVMEEGKVFDCLVRPPILKHVATVAAKFPNLRMIVDHISKPYISKGSTIGLSGVEGGHVQGSRAYQCLLQAERDGDRGGPGQLRRVVDCRDLPAIRGSLPGSVRSFALHVWIRLA